MLKFLKSAWLFLEKQMLAGNVIDLREKNEKEDNNVIKITEEESKFFCNLPVEDPRLHNWMKEKSIRFDTGLIKIKLAGKIRKMVTDRKDFGTVTQISTITD